MKVVIAMQVRRGKKTLPADKLLVLLVRPIAHCNLLRALTLVSCSDRLVLVKVAVD